MSFRKSSQTVAVVLAVAGTMLGGPAVTSSAQAAVSDKPGVVGSPLTLDDNNQYDGYDVASDGAGNSYVGWISNLTPGTASRTVFLCTLPKGLYSCAGGIQHVDGLDISGAANLRVLTTPAGQVTLVWYHETQTPLYNGRDGRIAMATSQAGGPLSAPADVADGVSYGELLDAELGPGGALWTIVAKGAGTNSVQVREGVQNPEIALSTPFSPGAAQLTFAGTTPIVAMDSYGSISVAPVYARGVGNGFSGWTSVAKTWTAGAHFGLTATRAGVRLVTSIDNASYWPTVSRWTGSGFSTRRPTGDRNNCSAFSHDLGTDTSGRLVDASVECGTIAVADLPDTAHAGIVRIPSRGTFAGGNPQITSTSRGHAVVVWSVEDGPGGGNRLYLARVNLPGFDTAVHGGSAGGSVTVTGPSSCQPASSIAVAVHGSPAKGWKVSASGLKLGSTTIGSRSTLHGSSLTPDKVYTLTGTVTFHRGTQAVSAKAVLKFRACANP